MGLGTLPESQSSSDEDGEGGIFAEINITPLTDVILVLLIIVMVYAASAVTVEKQRAARAIKAQRSGLKVNLPEGAAKEIDVTRKSLVIEIPATGEVAVNGQKVAEEELEKIFRNAYAADKETQVVLKADGATAHRRVVGVMELAKSVGLTKLAIATKGGGE